MQSKANMTTPTLQEIAISKNSGITYDKSELKNDTVAVTGMDSKIIKNRSFLMANLIYSLRLSMCIFKNKLTRLESPMPKISAWMPIYLGKIKMHKNKNTSPAR